MKFRFFNRKTIYILILMLISILFLVFNSITAGFDFYNNDLPPSPPHPFWGNHTFKNAKILYPNVLTPNKFLNLFHFSQIQKQAHYGKGERILVIENVDAYSPSSMSVFDHTLHLQNNLNLIHIIRIDDPPAGTNPETMLDVEWLHAIVPHATIYVLEIPGISEIKPIYNAVKYIHPNVISYSYTMIQPGAILNLRLGTASFASILWNISKSYPLFASSGDNRSEIGLDAFPDIVSVGGVKISSKLSPTNKPFLLKPWSKSGRGFADFIWYRPSWQFNQSSPWRETPDVSMLAWKPFVWVYSQHQWRKIAGTSLATPIWAGIWALADRLHVQITGSHLPTDANQILYYLARTHKNTFLNKSQVLNPTNQFIGLGVPNVPNLINTLGHLKTFPKPVSISPSAFGMWTNHYTRAFLYLEITFSILIFSLFVYSFRLLEKPIRFVFSLTLILVNFTLIPLWIGNVLMRIGNPLARDILMTISYVAITSLLVLLLCKLFQCRVFPQPHASQNDMKRDVPSNPN